MKVCYIYKVNVFLIYLLVCFFIFSCKQKNVKVKNADIEIFEYPIVAIPDTIITSIDDSFDLYPVSEEFLHDFMHRANDYQGKHVQTQIPFPSEWGVICAKYLPDDRELWLLQSKNREWIYLVISSGSTTQRIYDLLPVAVNIAVQEDNTLETEIWTTTIQLDGSFVVEKHYEWTKSVNKSDTVIRKSSYQRKSSSIDTYSISKLNRFEFINQKQNKNYNAIVFYYDQDYKPEEWDNYVERLESYCEEHGIFYQEINKKFNSVLIEDYTFNTLDTIDITEQIGFSTAGMLMIKSGTEQKNILFGSYERMISEIRRFFKLLENDN